jgi:hypothetical protein
MSFPTGTTISTVNLDSATDSPASARTDLLDTVNAVNDIIASENLANGVVVLNASGKLPSSTIPAQITLASGVQIINPVDGVVNIRDVLRMQQMSTVDILALTTPQAGDIAFATDGDSTAAALCIYDGDDWRTLSLSSLGFLA